MSLEGFYFDFAFLKGLNAVSGRGASGERRDAGHVIDHRRAADLEVVGTWALPRRSVHDELDAAVLDKVHDIGPPLMDFPDNRHFQSIAGEGLGGSLCSHQFEAHICQPFGDEDDRPFIFVFDRDEDCPF